MNSKPRLRLYEDPLNTGFTTNYKPMTIGDWLITFLIQAIPLAGFIITD
jgi:hypothetical protein